MEQGPYRRSLLGNQAQKAVTLRFFQNGGQFLLPWPANPLLGDGGQQPGFHADIGPARLLGIVAQLFQKGLGFCVLSVRQITTYFGQVAVTLQHAKLPILVRGGFHPAFHYIHIALIQGQPAAERLDVGQ